MSPAKSNSQALVGVALGGRDALSVITKHSLAT